MPIDLETVCLKCLEKEPGRRYPTAEALNGDLRRFLGHQPIRARPTGIPGRVGRWCRRKPAVAGLLVALHVVLAVGLAAILWQWQRAEKGERAARRGQLIARQKTSASDMGLVQQALAESNPGRAHELLNRHRPGPRSEVRTAPCEMPDLRGWEWGYLWRQCQGEQRFILGEHTHGISAVGLLVDGKTVFSAGGTNAFVCGTWSRGVRSDSCPIPRKSSVRPLARWPLSSDRRHQSDFRSLGHAASGGNRTPFRAVSDTGIAAVAPGGRLAFASRQGEVVLWDVGRSEKINFAKFGTNNIRRLVFSPDRRYLAPADDFKLASEMAGSNDDLRRRVRVWDVDTREEVRTFSPNGAFLWSLAYSSDSKALIGGTRRGFAMLWNLDGPAEPSAFRAHPGFVSGVALLPDRQTFVVASGDLILWDARNRRQTGKLSPRAGLFSALALPPDGHRMAAGGSDGRITIWDVASREETATFEGYEEEVTQLAFTAEGDQLVSVSRDQLRVWRASPWPDVGATENVSPAEGR